MIIKSDSISPISKFEKGGTQGNNILIKQPIFVKKGLNVFNPPIHSILSKFIPVNLCVMGHKNKIE